MPAIRKIRIVNFRFNDGAKLIPDEIFCTENAEGKPIDTLLNLDNGGGKSVIVQLLLQPVSHWLQAPQQMMRTKAKRFVITRLCTIIQEPETNLI